MRDGNLLALWFCFSCRVVVSLPMRDGNTKFTSRIFKMTPVVSLPMRDGNLKRWLKDELVTQLLAYL